MKKKQTVYHFESGLLVPTQEYSKRELRPSIPLEKEVYYYVVYGTYTTGDSFGRDPELKYEFIDAYKTYEEAAECAKLLRKKNDLENRYFLPSQDKNEAKKIKETPVMLADGVHTYDCPPWDNYFDCLDELFVEAAIVMEHPMITKF